MKGLASKALIILSSIFMLYGCVGGRAHILDIEYAPEKIPPRPFMVNYILDIVLIPPDEPHSRIIGKWVGLRGAEDTIKSSRPVGEAVTEAIFDYLEKVGFNVSMAKAGTSFREFTSTPPDFVMRVGIEKLKIRATSTVGYTTIETELKLRLKIKNVKDGSILTVNIESTSEPRTVVSFDPDVFAETVNTVVADALERIFSGLVLEEGVLRARD